MSDSLLLLQYITNHISEHLVLNCLCICIHPYVQMHAINIWTSTCTSVCVHGQTRRYAGAYHMYTYAYVKKAGLILDVTLTQ